MTDLPLPEKDQKISIDLLNSLLANEFVLFVQTLNYHWNLTGPEFHDYHKFFDDHYHELIELIDSLAERVRMVNGIALGTMKEFLAKAQLKEHQGAIPKPKEMIQNLLQSHITIISALHKGIIITAEQTIDAGTNNFLTDLLEKHEKIAWMLRSLD